MQLARDVTCCGGVWLFIRRGMLVVVVGDFAGCDGGLWDYGGELDVAGDFFRRKGFGREFLVDGLWLAV